MPKMFNCFNAEILKEKPKQIELSSYDDKDLMFIKAVAIYEGVNANGALFERADLHKAKNTFVGKPLRIRFVDNNPTGHGYNPETNRFEDIVENIGVIHSVEAEIVTPDGNTVYAWEENLETEGVYQIVIYAVVWQRYYPEIANRMRELYADSDLKFSIEADRDFLITDAGYRKCFNINFNGLAVVENPAFEGAKAMLVAEIMDKKGENLSMEFKELYEKELEKNVTLSNELASVKEQLQGVQNEMASATEKNLEKEAEFKEVVAERDKYKDVVEKAEKEKLGQERLQKLSKYGEVAKTAEELAEMTKESFVDLMAEMVENYTPETQGAETAESNGGVIGTPHFKNDGANNVSRKEMLLQLVEGLSK